MSKNAFLRNCFAFTLLLIFSANANAQVNWVGATSTDWATGSNWSNGAVPGVLDNVQIGVAHFNFQPTLSGTTSVRNLTFGGNVPVILTILANDTLKVINKIVQNHSGDGLAPSTLITGAGAITCTSVMVGDLTSPCFVQSRTSTLASKISAFVVTGSIDLNSVTENLLTGGVANNNSFFSLQGGTLLLGGKINTISRLPQNCNSFGTNNPNSRFSIDINCNQDAVLKLIDSSAVNISNPNYATVDFYNHISDTGRSRVEYIGANQLLYTNTVAGVDVSPNNYQDLTIGGTGIKTAGTDSTSNQLNINGNLRINSSTLDLKKYAPQTVVAGNFRNTGTVNFGTGTTTINGISFFNAGGFNQYSGVIQFAGASQALIDSTSTGTNFRRVGFYHTGTKAIQSGKFAVVPRGKVRLADTANLNAVTGASFIIRADSTGSASIAALPGGCTVTGNVNVEQYFQGSAYMNSTTARGYKFLTSPVNHEGALSGDRTYNFDFTRGTNGLDGLLITGPSHNGFDTVASLNMFLQREDVNFNGGSGGCQTCSSYKGIIKLNYSDPDKIGTQQRFTTNGSVADTIISLPIGNAIYFFFRGNRIYNNGTTSGTKTIAPYNYTETVTVTHKGVVNQGEVKVRSWHESNYYLSYTNSPTIVNSTEKGHNLLGNPYPSPINLDNFSSTDSTSTIYGQNLAPVIYTFDPITHAIGSYIPDPTHDRTQRYFGTNGMSNIIATGQGFDVNVDQSSSNPYQATFTIREGAKFDPDATSWPSIPSFMTGFALAQNQSNSGIKRSLSLAAAPNRNVSNPKSSNNIGDKTVKKVRLHTAANFTKKKITPSEDRFFRLKLIQDSTNYDDIIIRFGEGAADKYNNREDAFDLGGTEEVTTMLSSYSSDHIPLAINKLPFPVRSKNILLFTDAKESGAYSLKARDLQNISSNYNIRLKDKLNGRIINLRLTDHYDFNIDKTVAASFGDRFEVIITNGVKN